MKERERKKKAEDIIMRTSGAEAEARVSCGCVSPLFGAWSMSEVSDHECGVLDF